MKLITTLIYIMGFQYISLCQTTTTQQPAGPASCAMNYSEDSQALTIPEPVKCREIVISALPPLTQSVTPLNVEFGMTGAFTFKKDASLDVQDDRDIYIEDMLTGKIFNLKTSDSYTFNVNRRVPDRFVLHVDKMIFKYAVSSSGK